MCDLAYDFLIRKLIYSHFVERMWNEYFFHKILDTINKSIFNKSEISIEIQYDAIVKV